MVAVFLEREGLAEEEAARWKAGGFIDVCGRLRRDARRVGPIVCGSDAHLCTAPSKCNHGLSITVKMTSPAVWKIERPPSRSGARIRMSN